MNSTISEEITDFETELAKNKRRDNIISSSLVNYSTKIQSMVDDKMDLFLIQHVSKERRSGSYYNYKGYFLMRIIGN